MKIDRLKHRTISNPLVGVKFAKAEEDHTDWLAQVLYQMPDDMQLVVRSALAHEVRRLDELGDWTNGEMDDNRREQRDQALLALRALDKARFIPLANA